MGREIRRVPPNWEHPKEYRRHGYDYKPLLDKSYDVDAKRWLDNCLAWAKGEHRDQLNLDPGETRPTYYWEWNGRPPDPESYVKYDKDDAVCTWWQCYETVSEGTPVSPPFATAEELIDYLATNGDFWEQSRAAEEQRPLQLPQRSTVEKFVYGGWAPSIVIATKGDTTVAVCGINALDIIEENDWL